MRHHLTVLPLCLPHHDGWYPSSVNKKETFLPKVIVTTIKITNTDLLCCSKCNKDGKKLGPDGEIKIQYKQCGYRDHLEAIVGMMIAIS